MNFFFFICFNVNCLSLWICSGKISLNTIKQLDRLNKIKHYFMSFSAVPTIEKRDQIAKLGVTFLEYIPNNTYVANLDQQCDLSALKNYDVISLLPIFKQNKL